MSASCGKPSAWLVHPCFSCTSAAPFRIMQLTNHVHQAELALTSDETPVGCVFVKDGEIIGRGMNETNRTLNGTRHAEFVAIAGILSKNPLSILHETDLYVTVEPCVMCASMLRQYGIRAVYFGCWNERFGGTGGVLNIHSEYVILVLYRHINCSY